MPQYLDRLAEVAKRITPGQGEEVLQRVGAELLYAIILENDRPEHQLLGGNRLFIGRVALGASVGNFSTVRFGAAVAGGVVAVLTHVIFEAGTMGVNFAMVSTAGAPGGFVAGGVAAFRDGRAKGSPMNGFFTRQTTQVITGAHLFIQAPATAGLVDIVPLNIVVTSGAQAQLQPYWETTAVNTALAFTVLGYERALDAHEVDSTVV